MPLPSDEQLLASAAHYLIQGQQQEEAMLLLLCSIELRDEWTQSTYDVCLTGPRAVYDVLKDSEHPSHQAIWDAFNAVMPSGLVTSVRARAQLVDIENSDWRTEMIEEAHGRGIHNQGTELPSRKIVLWKNLRFRSEAERRIAAALDATGVLFLPNCMARLNIGNCQSPPVNAQPSSAMLHSASPAMLHRLPLVSEAGPTPHKGRARPVFG